MALSRRHFVFSTTLSAGAALVAPALLGEPQKEATPAADLRDWRNVRSLFNLSPEWTHAALFIFASHPAPVRRAIDEIRTALDQNPYDAVEDGAFGGPDKNLQFPAMAAVAKYIGASLDDVALTSNTTSGLAMLYHGLMLKPGDEILTTAHDHIVHHESIRYANERSGATSRRFQLFTPHDASGATEASLVGRIRKAIGPKTRVLGLTWVHSSSGVKLPLRAIAAAVAEINATRSPAERVLVFVDGVHGLGADDPEIATTGIDGFAAGLHKWIFAPRGTGFVWAKPEVWAAMRPTIPSFSAEELYVAWTEDRAPKGRPIGHWFSPGGFQAYEHHWAIPAALDLHAQIGSKRIQARIAELNGAAKSELAKMPHVRLRTPMDPLLSAGLIAFDVDGMKATEVAERLRAKRIIGSTSPYGVTYPRLSFGIANSEQDVERAVAAVRAIRG